ncbi:sensor histidine kinase [Planobispora takensis]|uniref:sensor histidine kinase n=1 Tax=Planobispora takensis TaxID=1367882 RepID=UPI001944FF8E|nr:histidine kinase [Planobispora takensis]
MRDVPVDPGTGLTNFRRHTWWSLFGVTAFFLVYSVARSRIMDAATPVPVRLAAVAVLALTVVAVAVSVSRRIPPVPLGSPGTDPGGPPPVRWLAAGGVGGVVLGVTLLALGDYGLWSFGPAMMVSIIATFLPGRRRWPLIAATAAGAAVLGGVAAAVSGRGSLFAAAFPAALVVFTGWVTLGMLWAWDVAERLNAARRLSADLAVKDERLRFAADLHDIQGHHLQVIALKSELAARLMEADPARAATEVEEIRRLAADALRDTRAVVQGYRRVTLEEEITNATRVLAAAGTDARMDLDPSASGLLPDPGRHLLGLVMREATTNVLRHSRARHVEVGYRTADGLARLTVANDGAPEDPGTGREAGPGTGPRETGSGTGPGTGLRTLAERLRAAGGELTWRHDGDRFVVAACLPVEAR